MTNYKKAFESIELEPCELVMIRESLYWQLLRIVAVKNCRTIITEWFMITVESRISSIKRFCCL